MSEKPTGNEMLQPFDEDAERYFVGGLLRHFAYFDDLECPVPADAVFHPRMRTIYRAILDLAEENLPVDAVTVYDRVKANGWVREIGGEYAIPDLLAEVVTGANVQRHAEIILNHWRRRQLVAHALEAAEDARNHGDPSAIASRLESRLADIEAARADSTLFSIGDVALEVHGDVRDRKESGRTAIGVPTGFMDFDALTGGLVRGEMVVVGARPSQGKTAFASNMLRNAAEHAPVLFVSIEMSRRQIGERMLSSESNVDALAIRQAAISKSDLEALENAAQRLGLLDFMVADLPGAGIGDVLHAIRQDKRRRPGLAVVAVDYLQLIENDDRRVSRQEQVASISRRLKGVARALNVCVVALSQLNRKSEERKDKRPEMSDLRESGAVEQDADVIALLHRPEQHDPGSHPGEADLIVCKVRSGPIGEVVLHFDKRTTTFRNATNNQQIISASRHYQEAIDSGSDPF